jgi:hypothetical protein
MVRRYPAGTGRIIKSIDGICPVRGATIGL